MGVDGESGADFYLQTSSPVVTGGEFEVHTSPLAIACFVFDPNVGNWNLSSNDPKPMPFGNEMFCSEETRPGPSFARSRKRRFFIS